MANYQQVYATARNAIHTRQSSEEAAQWVHVKLTIPSTNHAASPSNNAEALGAHELNDVYWVPLFVVEDGETVLDFHINATTAGHADQDMDVGWCDYEDWEGEDDVDASSIIAATNYDLNALVVFDGQPNGILAKTVTDHYGASMLVPVTDGRKLVFAYFDTQGADSSPVIEFFFLIKSANQGT